MSERWIGFREGVEVASYSGRAEANAALERREVQSVAPANQGGVFDWRSHVRTLAEAGGLYPADIALDVIDKMVSSGEVSITDESTKEIVYTEASNYAERYFRENGFEF